VNQRCVLVEEMATADWNSWSSTGVPAIGITRSLYIFPFLDSSRTTHGDVSDMLPDIDTCRKNASTSAVGRR